LPLKKDFKKNSALIKFYLSLAAIMLQNPSKKYQTRTSLNGYGILITVILKAFKLDG
jgi:hypothetical protein